MTFYYTSYLGSPEKRKFTHIHTQYRNDKSHDINSTTVVKVIFRDESIEMNVILKSFSTFTLYLRKRTSGFNDVPQRRITNRTKKKKK